MAKKKKTDNEVERLKLLWERLQKDQKDAPYGRGAGISSVKIVSDGKGGKTVQISLSNGKKINDVGDKEYLYQAMAPKKRINLGRLMSLIEAVRTLGFDAVAMGLPPELKRALLQACQRCGIPLKVEKNLQQKKMIVLLNKREPVKKVKTSPKRVVAAPAVKKIRPAFSVMTSPKTLDVAVRFEQKRNKEYLALRLARCEKEAKEEFLTLCCQASSAFDRKKDGKLTEEEKKIVTFIKRYASKADNVSEFFSENREKLLKKMSLNDLPESLRKKCMERQERYKYICSARSKALEMAQMELKKGYYQKNAPINLSIAALVRLSASKMPAPKDRNLKNLTQTVSNMNSSLKQSRQELKQTLREKRKRIGDILAGYLHHEKGKETSRPASQNIHRHNFIETAVARDLLEKRTAAY